MNFELRTNASRLLKRAATGLSLPPSFPNLAILEKYANPALRVGGLQGIWTDKELNLPKVASFCEAHFEWGTRDVIIRRFRSLVWEGCVTRILRRATLAQDQIELKKMHALGFLETGVQHCCRADEKDAVGTKTSMISKYLNMNDREHRMDRISAAFVNRGNSSSGADSIAAVDDSSSFILKIHSSRQHVSTDRSLEYRIEIDAGPFVRLARTGIKGIRPEPSFASTVMHNSDDSGDDDIGARKRSRGLKVHPEPLSSLRMWCPAPMLERINPAIVREFEERKHGSQRRASQQMSESPETSDPLRSRKAKRKPSHTESESEIDVDSYNTENKKRSRLGTDTGVIRKHLAVNEHPKPSQALRVQDLVSKVRKSQAVLPPIARAASNPDVFRTQASRSLKPLDVAHKVARMARISSMPLPSLHPQPPSSRTPSSDKELPMPNPLTCDIVSTIGTENDERPFLYQIHDPCDPDLIQREDLLLHPPEFTFRWTEMTAEPEGRGGADSDNDSLFNEERALDNILQRNFLTRARETSASFKLKPSVPVTIGVGRSCPASLGYTVSPPRARARRSESRSSSPSSSEPWFSDESYGSYARSSSPTSVIEISTDEEDEEDSDVDNWYSTTVWGSSSTMCEREWSEPPVIDLS